MAKGVKKIKVVKKTESDFKSKWDLGISDKLNYFEVENSVYTKLSDPSKDLITVVPNQFVYFAVAAWFEDTTDAEKQKDLTWMLQETNRVIISQKTISGLKNYGIKIPKKLSGVYTYYVEASLFGKRDLNNQSGLYVRGYCPPKITNSAWAKHKGGNDVRKTHEFSYGDVLHLNLQTEGLNGDFVDVTIFRRKTGADQPIFTYTGVKVIDGEVNLEIKNTHAWYSLVGLPSSTEEFYVKVKHKKKADYVSDGKDTAHARFLRIKPNISSKNIDISKSNAPYKIGKVDINSDRYEPCKFEQIKIIETKEEEGKKIETSVLVFDNGKALKASKNNLAEKIERSIYFNFDSILLESESKTKLDNILKFLLEHRGSTINLSGYACVIGKQNYNKVLSKNRADAVKKFFVDGGLDVSRVFSVGKGEVDPTDDKIGRDNIKYKNELDYKENRRVDIVFTFYAHDAETIIYETIAPAIDTKKRITIDVLGQETWACFRENNVHKNQIGIVNVGQKIDRGTQATLVQTPGVYEIYSDLSRFNAFPLQYIWPAATNPNQFKLYIHSCRWFSNKKNATVLIKVYPDIKWELAFEFQVEASNYKAANMPAGEIYKKHQEKARKAGYERWRLNEHGKLPIALGVGLSAQWNDKKTKREFKNEISTKIEAFAKVMAKAINIGQDAVNFAQSAAKATSFPVAFDVKYPNLVFVGAWSLERFNDDLKVNTKGEINIALKPLIGIKGIVDIIGAAITTASYATTANPAAARLISQFRGGLEKLGASLTFEAEFYGELEVEFNGLEIIKGKVKANSKTTIGGKLGIRIIFEMNIDIGKLDGKQILPVKASFKAELSADGYFGGDLVIDSDSDGIFVQPVLKFSGVKISGEIKGEVGWWKSSFKLEEVIVKEDDLYLDKKYIN